MSMREAERAKVDALGRVERGAEADWLAAARQTVMFVANTKATFTSDDVWEFGLPKPREPRALGAVMAGLSRDGQIHTTGLWIKSRSTTRNNAPIAVWAKGT